MLRQRKNNDIIMFMENTGNRRSKSRLLRIVEVVFFAILTLLFFFSVAFLQPTLSFVEVVKTALPFLAIAYFFFFLSFKIFEYYYFQLLYQQELLEKLNNNLLKLSSKLKTGDFLKSSLEVLIYFCRGNKGTLLVLDDSLKRYTPEEIVAINTNVLDRKNSDKGYRMFTFNSGSISYEVENRVRELIKEYNFENSSSVMVIPIAGNKRIRAVVIIGISIPGKKSAKIFMEMQNIMDVFIKQINIGLENSILHEEVEQASIKDPLTNLFNRRFFNTRKKEEFAKAKRMGFPISIMISDLDNFKNYIDTYGHPKGDILLYEAAGVVNETLRETDIPCRFGGDEFAYLLPFTSSIEAKTVAERVKKAISQFPFLKNDNDHPVHLTMSIGIASFPEHGKEAEDVLSNADRALFLSKDRGKNTITVYKE